MNRTLLALAPAALLVALLATPAAAAPRISLITFPPGEDLPSAFGHTMLRVDRDGDLASTADQAVYDFGVWSLTFDPLGQGPDQLADLFSGLLNGEQPARKRVQDGPGVQSSSPRLFASAWEQPLLLPEEDLVELADLLAEEFDFADPDGDGVGETYTYRHFTGNCATEFRDRIAAVLAPAWRARLEETPARGARHRRDLVQQDLGRAMLLAGGSLRTLPAPDWEQHGAFLEMAGGSERVRAPSRMFQLLERMVRSVRGFLRGERAASARERIAGAWARFQETMSSPVSRWDAAYTPERLRRLLADEGLLGPAVLEAPAHFQSRARDR